MASGGVVGDQLGEMGQQMGSTADAVLGKQAAVGQVTNGSVEPGPVASITTVAVSPTAQRPSRGSAPVSGVRRVGLTDPAPGQRG